MSNKEDYDARINEIMAIEDSEIKTPNNIPLDTYLQESENLYHWCRQDMDALTAAGLDWTLVTDLPVRAGALREAESVWNLERFSREDAAQQWAEDSPKAYDLRTEILHVFRFAFRNNPDLLKKVGQIAEGNGHANMIQDLNDLSVLGKKYPDLLTAVAFDPTRLDTAAQYADDLASLYAMVTGERIEYTESKKIRDKAHTYLKAAIDAIYGYGQFIFWQNEDRRMGYRSNYIRRKKMRQASSENETNA